MTEPDVVVTDALLTIEALLFSVLVWRSASIDPDLRAPFLLFFAGTALSAFAGAIVHGFFAAATSGVGVALWRATLIALGVVAFATWMIGGRMLLPAHGARIVEIAAGIVAVAYAVIIIAGNDRFSTAIVHYLPPTLFLLIAFAIVFARTGESSMLAGVAGLVLTLGAAFVQQRGISVHPVYFNHNALYHAIQAVGLFLIFVAARTTPNI